MLLIALLVCEFILVLMYVEIKCEREARFN